MKGRKPYTQEQVINKFKKIHGDKYIYDQVEYQRMNKAVTVTCPIHGNFLITPSKHCIGQGCPMCGIMKKSKSQAMSDEEYIKRCNVIHNGKYIYDKTHTNGNLHNKVIITCPTHGDFEQIAQEHLKRHGCTMCAIENSRLKTEEFIERSNVIHNNFYLYDKTDVNGIKNEVIITCPIHGDFKQTPEAHLKGSGCPICKQSHLENEIRVFLIDNNIDFEQQKTFEWLRNINPLFLDFYLPQYNIAIECQGEQHFKPINYFGGRENFEIVEYRDDLKNKLCKEHNVKILYYTHCDCPYRYKLINSLKELKEAILN